MESLFYIYGKTTSISAILIALLVDANPPFPCIQPRPPNPPLNLFTYVVSQLCCRPNETVIAGQ